MGFIEFCDVRDRYTTLLEGRSREQIEKVISRWEEGAPVAYLARYCQDELGGLTESEIWNILEVKEYHSNLEHRQQTVIQNIEKQGKLSEELKAKILATRNHRALEDLYAAFRPKNKTRAGVAIDKGLAELAGYIWNQGREHINSPRNFVNPTKAVTTAEEALAGALDIVAEKFADDADLRAKLRHLAWETAVLFIERGEKATDERLKKYKDYLGQKISVQEIATSAHRTLAIFRGVHERCLKITFQFPEGRFLAAMTDLRPSKPKSTWPEQLETAKKDAWGRLIRPSLEGEIREDLEHGAHEQAIEVFAQNVRQLLMAAPFGAESVIGIDAGLANGCRVVALSDQGELLEKAEIFPNEPQNDWAGAAATLVVMMKKHGVKAVVVGDGTGGRETLNFVRDVLKKGKEEGILTEEIPVCLVAEAGAALYAESDFARMELPDTENGFRIAVSIGRKFQDPLRELIKIDMRQLGVGLYQHDLNQGLMKKKLDQVIESCLNDVGVNLNAANFAELASTAGLGPALARMILDHKKEHGIFKKREDLLAVKKMTPKVFGYCAPFLRIEESANPLEQSRIPPAWYDRAGDLGLIPESEKHCRALIERELAAPGKDPRREFEFVRFDDSIKEITDLKPNMELPGVVTNLTSFGAFVDVGISQDGLIHLSQITDKFIRDPGEVLYIGQPVTVRVINVDLGAKRISFSLRGERPKTARRPREQRAPQNARPSAGGVVVRPIPAVKDAGRGPKPIVPGSGGPSVGPKKLDKPRGPRRERPVFNNPMAAALANLKLPPK